MMPDPCEAPVSENGHVKMSPMLVASGPLCPANDKYASDVKRDRDIRLSVGINSLAATRGRQMTDELLETATEPRVSDRVRRWTRIVILGVLIGVVGYLVLVAMIDRRSVEFRTAEQAFADLQAGGFGCKTPYFPTGNNEPSGQSTATCERGLSTVHILVKEDGEQFSLNSEPYERGEAAVEGSNWAVVFEAPNSRSLALAQEVQRILGGNITHPLPQQD